MKKNNRNQLELPILTEISAGSFQTSTKNSQQNAKLPACFSDDDVKAADSDDIKIYHSISNAYFKALSTQKR